MTLQRSRRWLAFLCLITSVLATATAWAQSGRATVSGIVTDASGAVVSGVEVTATNQDTNVVTSAATNSSGRYTLLNLPVGPYTITFKKEGFKKEGFKKPGFKSDGFKKKFTGKAAGAKGSYKGGKAFRDKNR